MNRWIDYFSSHHYQSFIIAGMLIFASCSPIDYFYSQPSKIPMRGNGCNKSTASVPKNVAVRKNFLTKQTIQPSSQRQRLSFQIDDPVDLRRRMLLSAKQGEKNIKWLKVWANGQQVQTFLMDSTLLWNDTPDMVVDLCPYLIQGTNTLELEMNGDIGSSAEMFVEGFMVPVDIPDALHSYGSPFIGEFTVNRVLILKFLEGMKFRLNQDLPVAEQLVEQSEISLYPLRLFIQQFGVLTISRYSYATPEEEDKREAERQSDGSEVPNDNTMYVIQFESKDVDTLMKMAAILQGMPFFESIHVNNPDSILNGSLK